MVSNPVTGRNELHTVRRVVVEPRDRSSTGQVTAMGARVINESPLERMYGRAELFPGDSHRNEALYQAGLRLRGDFEAAGVRLGGDPSMEPRVDSGARDPEGFIRSKAFQATAAPSTPAGRCWAPSCGTSSASTRSCRTRWLSGMGCRAEAERTSSGWRCGNSRIITES